MANRITWRGPQAKAAVEAHFRRLLTAACILVTNRVRELVSVAAEQTSSGAGKRDAKGRYLKASKRHVGSEPGEPPRKRTGRLRASYTYEIDGMRGRVGSNLEYARWLELGTRFLQARPHLRRALAECRSKIVALLRGARPL